MFTEAERRVVELTVDLFKAMSELPVEHEWDMPEAVSAIHRIQDLVISRPGRRFLNAPST